jgi:hexulose-6-phosphate isomerase
MEQKRMERRSFLKYTATFGTGLVGTSIFTPPVPVQAQAQAGGKRGAKLRKAIQLNMLPKKLTDADKFKLAKKCGFEGIEAYPMNNLDAARQQGRLARAAGVPIHSIVFGGWQAPFSDPNPKVIKRGLEGMEAALRCAKAMGADAVLLVPALVKENVSYADAYKRSQKHIRKLLPQAKEVGVVIAIENVWNKFLLSPLEFARYVDEFDSPWVQAYFDVGNVIIYGYAQHWIRTLGKRLVKIHLKDFKRRGYQWKNLREGDVNWPEVSRALDEIGYNGFITPELSGGDETYLRDLVERIDLIIAGK